MKAPDSTNNSFYLKIDNCAVLVGDSSSIPANTWTWVDYKNGSSSNKIEATLSPGTHVVTLIGNEDGVGVDKILMTQNLTCVPTGISGDNCPAEVSDTNAPVISNISASEVTGTTAKINWSLDEFATGQVEYGTSNSYGSFTTKETSFNYNQHIQSMSGLTNGVTYHYRVISEDASGNKSVSGDCTFTTGGAATQTCNISAPTPTNVPATNTPTPTKAPTATPTSTPNDTTPPVISNPRVEEVTGTAAKFKWELDELASGQVEYRPRGTNTWTKTGIQVCTPSDCRYDYHVQSVSGLTNGTTYEYRITSADVAGNSSTSQICTFIAGGAAIQTCGSVPTSTPTPTAVPTNTPTPTKAPTSTPVPTPLPTDTVLNFQSVLLHGIGNGGDNTNPTSAGNPSPVRTTRQLSVELIDASGNSLPTVTGNVTYRSNSSQRDFVGNVILPTSVSTGSYLVKVKSPQFLKKQVVGIITITKGAVTNIAKIALTTGDIDNNNTLTISDYNILIDCYSDLLPAKNCADPAKKISADLSDDGNVNANDYNLFLRELSVVSGD
jgi:hypothetical protein